MHPEPCNPKGLDLVAGHPLPRNNFKTAPAQQIVNRRGSTRLKIDFKLNFNQPNQKKKNNVQFIKLTLNYDPTNPKGYCRLCLVCN